MLNPEVKKTISRIRNKLIRDAFKVHKSRIEERKSKSTTDDYDSLDMDIPEEDKPNILPIDDVHASLLITDKGSLKLEDLKLLKAHSQSFRPYIAEL